MAGKNYFFLKNIPDIPSIIEEEELEGGSSIRYNSSEKKKNYLTESAAKQSTNNFSNIPLESRMESKIQYSDIEEKQSSKLSERIRKHR